MTQKNNSDCKKMLRFLSELFCISQNELLISLRISHLEATYCFSKFNYKMSVEDNKTLFPKIIREAVKMHSELKEVGLEKTIRLQPLLSFISQKTAMEHVRMFCHAHAIVEDIFKDMNIDTQDCEDILNSLDNLFSSTDKCVLRLRYAEECDVFESAQILGISPNEVRTIEYNAMENIRILYERMRSNDSVH